MADVKKVLVVDDHFEMLEFLRSMLELSAYDYEVLAVPSAEEGMYELRRSAFDLLITDVRLPGMSGFDLARRARSQNPDLPIIMITAYSSPQGKKEAEELGVYRYFGKPLDTDEVLTAVNTLLHEPEPEEEPPPPTPELTDIQLPAGVDKRLTTLGTDTGAAQVLLVTVHGQILRQVGSSRGVDISQLAVIIAGNLSNNAQLAEHLGGDGVSTIQYHAGKRMEMYTANVGSSYFLLIVFEVQVRRGRFGTIWVFAQRAIKDLLPLLPPLDATAGSTAPIKPPAAKRTRKAPPSKKPEPKPRKRRGRQAEPASKPAAPPPKEKKKTPKPTAPEPPSFFVDAEGASSDTLFDKSAEMEIDLKSLLGASDASDSAEIDFEEAAEEEAASASQPAMSLEEAQKMGLIGGGVFSEEEAAAEPVEETADLGELDGLLASEESDSLDLDDFWDTAVTESESEPTSGMSFAEARRQGLIPGDMDAE